MSGARDFSIRESYPCRGKENGKKAGFLQCVNAHLPLLVKLWHTAVHLPLNIPLLMINKKHQLFGAWLAIYYYSHMVLWIWKDPKFCIRSHTHTHTQMLSVQMHLKDCTDSLFCLRLACPLEDRALPSICAGCVMIRTARNSSSRCNHWSKGWHKLQNTTIFSNRKSCKSSLTIQQHSTYVLNLQTDNTNGSLTCHSTKPHC